MSAPPFVLPPPRWGRVGVGVSVPGASTWSKTALIGRPGQERKERGPAALRDHGPVRLRPDRRPARRLQHRRLAPLATFHPTPERLPGRRPGPGRDPFPSPTRASARQKRGTHRIIETVLRGLVPRIHAFPTGSLRSLRRLTGRLGQEGKRKRLARLARTVRRGWAIADQRCLRQVSSGKHVTACGTSGC